MGRCEINSRGFVRSAAVLCVRPPWLTQSSQQPLCFICATCVFLAPAIIVYHISLCVRVSFSAHIRPVSFHFLCVSIVKIARSAVLIKILTHRGLLCSAAEWCVAELNIQETHYENSKCKVNNFEYSQSRSRKRNKHTLNAHVTRRRPTFPPPKYLQGALQGKQSPIVILHKRLISHQSRRIYNSACCEKTTVTCIPSRRRSFIWIAIFQHTRRVQMRVGRARILLLYFFPTPLYIVTPALRLFVIYKDKGVKRIKRANFCIASRAHAYQLVCWWINYVWCVLWCALGEQVNETRERERARHASILTHSHYYCITLPRVMIILSRARCRSTGAPAQHIASIHLALRR